MFHDNLGTFYKLLLRRWLRADNSDHSLRLIVGLELIWPLVRAGADILDGDRLLFNLLVHMASGHVDGLQISAIERQITRGTTAARVPQALEVCRLFTDLLRWLLFSLLNPALCGEERLFEILLQLRFEVNLRHFAGSETRHLLIPEIGLV